MDSLQFRLAYLMSNDKQVEHNSLAYLNLLGTKRLGCWLDTQDSCASLYYHRRKKTFLKQHRRKKHLIYEKTIGRSKYIINSA
jgi:hypothetical protein